MRPWSAPGQNHSLKVRSTTTGAQDPRIGNSSSSAEATAVTDRAYRLPILISLASLLVVLFFYLELRRNVQPPSVWIYWIALVGTFVPGILSKNRIAAAFGIGVFAFLQSFAYVLSSPYGIVYITDPIYNLQLADLIAKTHTWTPAMGSSQVYAYSFYPASGLYQASISLATGLPLPTTFMFGSNVLRFAVLPIALFRIFRRFLHELPSFIALAIFFSVPSSHFFLPVQQEFAYVFVVLALYAAILSSSIRSRFVLSPAAIVACFLFLTTVALSHYFTAYIFTVILVVLAAGTFVRRAPRPAKSLTVARANPVQPVHPPQVLGALRYAAPAYAYVFLLWSLYVSSPIDLFWFSWAEGSFERAFSPGSVERPGGASAEGVRPGYTYSELELVLIAAAVILLVAIAFLAVGMLLQKTSQTRSTRKPAVRALLALFAFAITLVFISAPLIFTTGLFIPLRVLEFAALGIAPLDGLFLAYLLTRRSVLRMAVVAILVSVIVIGGSLMQSANPRFYYISEEARYCEMPSHLTLDVVAAATWAKEHANPSARVFGDSLVYDSFGGYGSFHIEDNYLLYSATTINASLEREVGFQLGDLIVVHAFLTDSICFSWFHTTPFNQTQVGKFSASPVLAKLFENGSVTIFRWDRFV